MENEQPDEPSKDAFDEVSAELRAASRRDAASRRGSRARADDAYHMETAKALRDIWDRLAAGAAPRRVSTELMEEHGYSRATADRWVGAALKVLYDDAATEPLESKRARIVSMALAGYERAMGRTRGLTITVGKGAKRKVRIELVPDPDAKGAAMFLAILAKIELGL